MKRRCAENLAAGIDRVDRLDPDTPLLDPMCGSGTIAIEAALIAAERARLVLTHLRLPETRVVRRTGMAADQARRRAIASDRRRQAPMTIFGSDVAAGGDREWRSPTSRRRRSRISLAPRAGRRTPSFGAPRRRASGCQSALWRAARRPREAGRALSAVSAMRSSTRFAGWTAYFLTGDMRLRQTDRAQAQAQTSLCSSALDCRLFAFRNRRGIDARKPRNT